MDSLILPPIASQISPETLAECTDLLTLTRKYVIAMQQMIFIHLYFVWHLSLLGLETVLPMTISWTENPLTSCCTAPSYPGSSSSSSPGSQQLLSLYSFLVPGSLGLVVLSCCNYNSLSLSQSSVIAHLCLGLLWAVSFHVLGLITGITVAQSIECVLTIRND